MWERMEMKEIYLLVLEGRGREDDTEEGSVGHWTDTVVDLAVKTSVGRGVMSLKDFVIT